MTAGSQQHDSVTEGLRLEASLPDWCALNWRQTLVGCSFVLLFMWCSYLPLPVAATWNAVQHGKAVSETSLFNTAIANTDSLPLSAGLRSFRIGAVSQWAIYQLHQIGGTEFLSAAFAAVQTLCCVLWAWLLTRISDRWWTAFLPTAFFLLPIHAQGINTFLIGQLCLVSLLILLTTRSDATSRADSFRIADLSIAKWIAVAVTLVLWCNSDPSFLLGWLLLVAILISRSFQCLFSKTLHWRTDRELRQRLILCEVALAVSLLTPAGVTLWSSLLWWPDQPIWLHFGAWQPLTFSGFNGGVVAGLILFWIVCSRKSKTIAAWQWLLPLACMLVMAFNESLVSMLALPFAMASLSMLPRLESKPVVVKESNNENHETPVLKFGLTLSFGLLVWLAFAFSPASTLLLGGQGRTIGQQLGSYSPHVAIGAIQKVTSSNSKAPFTKASLALTPRYWSDQILANVDGVAVFAPNERYLIPSRANLDYETIFRGQHGWQKLLDRYSVDLLLVDVKTQTRLMQNLRSQPGEWRAVHENATAAVYRRSNANE